MEVGTKEEVSVCGSLQCPTLGMHACTVSEAGTCTTNSARKRERATTTSSDSAICGVVRLVRKKEASESDVRLCVLEQERRTNQPDWGDGG